MKYHIILLMLIISVALFGQTEQWRHYNAAGSISAFSYHASDLWYTSVAGLCKLDSTTGELSRYHKLNSPLSTSSLSAVDIDSQGRVWVGAKYGNCGVYQLDNGAWQNFTSANSLLPSNTITFIKAAADGSVWIATAGGLARYRDGLWQSFSSANSILPAEITVNCMYITPDRALWIACQQGVYRYHADVWTFYSSASMGVSNSYIYSIAFDSQGRGWFGTDSGLISLADGSWTHYTANSGLPSDYVFSLAVDAQDNIWIGTYNGLVKKNAFGTTVYNTANSGLLDNCVYKLFADPQQNIWLGLPATENPLALNKFDGANWSYFHPSGAALSQNSITSMALGTGDKVWIGSSVKDGGGGASCYENGQWQHFGTYNTEMPCPCAHSVAADANGNAWVGTCLGLVKLTQTGSQYCPSSGSGLPSLIMAMAADNQGNLWTGYSSTGLGKFDGTSWTSIPQSQTGITIANTKVIKTDAEGKIWIGCNNGIACYDGLSWTNYTVANGSLLNNDVRDLCFDTQGRMWVANGVLSCLDNGIWTHYSTENSPLQTNIVMAVAAGRDGAIWLACTGEGIYKLDNGTWTNYNMSNSPIPSNSIRKLMVDGHNTLWMGTFTDGLCLFSESGFVAVESETLPAMEPGITVYPNPFNPSTSISFSNPVSGQVQVDIYNLRGQKVTSLHDAFLSKGEHNLVWNGTDAEGKTQSSGIYIISIKGQNYKASARISLVK